MLGFVFAVGEKDGTGNIQHNVNDSKPKVLARL